MELEDQKNITSGTLYKLLEALDDNYKKDKHTKQRGVGDMIEGYVIDEASNYSNFLAPTGAKATGDFGFLANNKNSLVDVKTNYVGAKMSMPNLISMKKLLALTKEKEELYYIFIGYSVTPENIKIENKKIVSVYDLDVKKLGIGALGFGQLQIKNYLKDGNNLTKKQTKDEFIKDIKSLYKDFIQTQFVKWNKVQKELEDK